MKCAIPSEMRPKWRYVRTDRYIVDVRSLEKSLDPNPAFLKELRLVQRGQVLQLRILGNRVTPYVHKWRLHILVRALPRLVK